MKPLVTALAGPAFSAAVLTATALIATAMPAVAAQTSHHDPTGDVVLLGVEDDSVTPQPSWRQGDIKRIRAAHLAHRIGARLAFREVRRGTTNFFFMRIHTARGRFEVDGFTSPDHPHGDWFLLGATGDAIRCAGLRHRVEYGNERVRASVPRRCIGGPARVQIGAGAQTFIDRAEQTRLDDAYSIGQVEHITFGPWLRRG